MICQPVFPLSARSSNCLFASEAQPEREMVARDKGRYHPHLGSSPQLKPICQNGIGARLATCHLLHTLVQAPEKFHLVPELGCEKCLFRYFARDRGPISQRHPTIRSHMFVLQALLHFLAPARALKLLGSCSAFQLLPRGETKLLSPSSLWAILLPARSVSASGLHAKSQVSREENAASELSWSE